MIYWDKLENNKKIAKKQDPSVSWRFIIHEFTDLTNFRIR